ncbi:DNA topoisomerase 2 [Artemisia annua]|uniref:DNA topoisomerase (ATP-hydrolyzing) n=1 Tax=Artemisia annua TaxID=35608 RepID=A0A2U1PCP9_ARTAN|nr:DNA topoisomerase 2 [Artemisia annua]
MGFLPPYVLVDFFRIRLDFYEKRRTALLRKLKIASGLLKNKVDFIGKVRKGEIPLFPLTGKDDWCAELKTKDIQSLPSINGEATEEKEPGTGYDYLGDIPSGWFKDEKFKELEQESKEKIKEYEEQYEELSISTHVSLWLSELTTLDLQLDKEGYTVKINSEDVDSEIAEEAPKMKARAKRPAARPQGANKKSRARSSKDESTSKTTCSQTTRGEQEESCTVSDCYEEEPEDGNDATEDSDFEDEE